MKKISKQIRFQYTREDYTTIQKPGISIPRLGLYKVLKHHAKGDISYEKKLNVTDKVNICCVYPITKISEK